jgi:hypothetical protein
MRKNSFICISTFRWCVLAASPFAGARQQTWVGYVTDTHCGTNCQVTKNTDAFAMRPEARRVGLSWRAGVQHDIAK